MEEVQKPKRPEAQTRLGRGPEAQRPEEIRGTEQVGKRSRSLKNAQKRLGRGSEAQKKGPKTFQARRGKARRRPRPARPRKGWEEAHRSPEKTEEAQGPEQAGKRSRSLDKAEKRSKAQKRLGRGLEAKSGKRSRWKVFVAGPDPSEKQKKVQAQKIDERGRALERQFQQNLVRAPAALANPIPRPETLNPKR